MRVHQVAILQCSNVKFRCFFLRFFFRVKVSLLIRRELVERARDFNIILDDVSLTELSFGKEYTAAVEAKQVAQQEAQRAAFYVERAVQEKQQKIVQAEGEAEAAKMISFFINTNRKKIVFCYLFPPFSCPHLFSLTDMFT